MTADELRRAHAVHPIAAVQSEYSLWERGIEAEVLPAARELGVGVVPFSPLGRGFLTGAFASAAELEAGDFRGQLPRFRDENARLNAGIVADIRDIAAARGVTPAQVALAWVHSRGEDVVPIPGTKRRRYLADNVAAVDLVLDPAELARLDTLAGRVNGDRYGTVWRSPDPEAELAD
jgi:aryl-alcohol dehydrogenase-like predicted oxidoreductase